MNLFEGELAARNGCDLYGVRPEHIDLGSGPTAPGRAAFTTWSGSDRTRSSTSTPRASGR